MFVLLKKSEKSSKIKYRDNGNEGKKRKKERWLRSKFMGSVHLVQDFSDLDMKVGLKSGGK